MVCVPWSCAAKECRERERTRAGQVGGGRLPGPPPFFFFPPLLSPLPPPHAPLKTVTASDPPLGHSQLSTQAAPRKGGMRWADGRERERVRAGAARLVFSSEVEEKKKGAAGPPAFQKSNTCVIYNPKNSKRGRKRSVRRCPSGLRGLTRRSYYSSSPGWLVHLAGTKTGREFTFSVINYREMRRFKSCSPRAHFGYLWVGGRRGGAAGGQGKGDGAGGGGRGGRVSRPGRARLFFFCLPATARRRFLAGFGRKQAAETVRHAMAVLGLS